MTDATPSTKVAQEYYDSNDADQFYFNIWGGEDIHVGIYLSPTESIREASRRTVETMAKRIAVSSSTHVLDLGSGYGGAARYLTTTFGCPVTCLNLSETQNIRNREINAKAGLTSIEVVQGNFERLSFDSNNFDCAWSQDAILHSSAREQVLSEVSRVLKPGGSFIFTDPMQRADAPREALAPILERIHLASLASFESYQESALRVGLEVVHIEDLSPHLAKHYSRVHDELVARRAELEKLASSDYIDRMLQGLERWSTAGQSGLLSWGILHFRKPA